MVHGCFLDKLACKVQSTLAFTSECCSREFKQDRREKRNQNSSFLSFVNLRTGNAKEKNFILSFRVSFSLGAKITFDLYPLILFLLSLIF